MSSSLQTVRRGVRGFTLIEIMVAMSLILALVGATFGVLIATNNTSQRIYRIANTQETARLALDMLAADIRSAGLGIASGEVGIAPGGGTASTYRIPVIFSGPDVVVQEPDLRSSLVTNSVFIISVEPTTMGLPADGSGTQGVVLDAGVVGANTPLEVLCGRADGGAIPCENTTDGIYLGSAPLLIGDLRNASIISPTAIGSSGNAGAELISYAEAGALSVNPKANYAIFTGAMLSRVRVVHWYLKQTDPSAPPRLYRSKPTLTKNSFNCALGGWPFVDETTSSVAGDPTVPVGVEMGAGPVQSLQIRYVLDQSGTNNTTAYQMSTAINPCDAADILNNVIPQAVSKLREVRVQVVSISTQPDLTTAGSAKQQIGYTTPPFEGSLWTPDGGSLTDAGPSTALTDPYPRRAFNVRVVPRAIQDVRL